ATVGLVEKVADALTDILAENFRQIDAKLVNTASPVEQHATLIADEILEDLRAFAAETPVFDVGAKTPNPVVKLTGMQGGPAE
ncbi:MAG: hypothetical protein KC439_15965, partial [Yoonia sp.]|nr:hypothetical protein [Yoonia sp.]